MRTLTKSRVFVVSLNALVLAVFIVWIWCEVAIYLGESPMAELFVFIVNIPALLVFGGMLLVLGRRFHIPLLNRLIPFIGVIWFFLFNYLLWGLSRFFPSLNQYLLNACIVVALSILTIATTVSIVRSKQNGSQTGKVRWLPKEDRMSRRKSVGIVAASIIVVIVVLVISLSEYGSVGGFPDRNLGRAIRAALNQTSGAIDVSELAGLTVLEAETKGIKDLSGLDHYCTNLTRLVLSCNEISDISPLANLPNLTYLDLDGNQISDISPLVSLAHLTYLNLSSIQITDISPLANLTNLTELWLAYNAINDVSPLAGLSSLAKLYLSGNQISGISPLANLTGLRELWLEQNEISDISGLASLTDLGLLLLNTNQIADISPLANLTNLRELGLYDNQISDVSSLVENPGISEGDLVELGGNPLSSHSINVYIPQLEARGVSVGR